jgi:copper chaperone CopZ
VSVAVKKIPGVESVNVSLNKGLVSIKLAPRNKVTMAQIRKAILDDAFTPKDAKVVAVGKLVSERGKLRFVVAGTDETFPVASTPHQSWQKDVARHVTVDGLLPAPAKGTEGGTLQITSVSEVATAGK